MTPEQVPAHLIAILDSRAGKAHGRGGPVVAALAEILTAYEAMRCSWVEITCVDEAYLTYICANCGKLGYAARERHPFGPTLDATRVAH